MGAGAGLWGTPWGQGAFREGASEGKAGPGCTRPAAGVLRSPGVSLAALRSVRRAGRNTCCCCGGSPVPADSNTPKVGFSQSLVLDPCGREGVQTLRQRHTEGRQSCQTRAARGPVSRSTCAVTARLSCSANFPEEGRLPQVSALWLHQQHLPKTAPDTRSLDHDACRLLSCERGQSKRRRYRPSAGSGGLPVSGLSAVKRGELASRCHMLVDDFFQETFCRRQEGQAVPPLPPWGTAGSALGPLGHPHGTTWLMKHAQRLQLIQFPAKTGRPEWFPPPWGLRLPVSRRRKGTFDN